MARRYAVVLGFDPERLARHWRTEAQALVEVGSIFAERGFSEDLPGFHLGESEIDAIRAVVAVQDVADGLAWFAACLRSARLLRIEGEGDLTIALS